MPELERLAAIPKLSEFGRPYNPTTWGETFYGFSFRPLVNSHWLHASSARHIAATTAKAIQGLTSEAPRGSRSGSSPLT